MSDPAQKMIQNLEEKYGKSFDEWIAIVWKQNFAKHGEILNFLKSEHGFTHGYANLVAHKAKKSDAGSAAHSDDLITAQYTGKTHFKPFYDELSHKILGFGKDVVLAPKKAYVSVRRKKQFAMLTPATKSRFEIGINLKGQAGSGLLEEITKSGSMCSHKICLTPESDITDEVFDWLKKAYDRAG